MRFGVDEGNLYEELGHATFVALSTEFYRRVAEDIDPEFRAIFDRDLSDAVQNQFEFFIQRFGGPPMFTQRKGHPALRMRHVDFAITRRAAQRWLGHMRDSMEAVGIPDAARAKMDQFFEHTADFLVNVDDEPTDV